MRLCWADVVWFHYQDMRFGIREETLDLSELIPTDVDGHRQSEACNGRAASVLYVKVFRVFECCLSHCPPSFHSLLIRVVIHRIISTMNVSRYLSPNSLIMLPSFTRCLAPK
ncbi:hypothetical protein NEOLEDRAFT_986179 [Neolentinus lepideus HHB14362 ss-1]|uniref:Uncharacterized protein n=1 Tax=Neolentinus lepideus HHB14362 ss-1 TaxID=1314782 RepID=A0A165N521_9AGAM|nr:hypothetical protein NEOLEDRAFT_986179 [Neolentinus lepideus HHB14362 ss-1]